MKTLRKARDIEEGQLCFQWDAATSAGNGTLTLVLYVLRRRQDSRNQGLPSASRSDHQLFLSGKTGSFTARRAAARVGVRGDGGGDQQPSLQLDSICTDEELHLIEKRR